MNSEYSKLDSFISNNKYELKHTVTTQIEYTLSVLHVWRKVSGNIIKKAGKISKRKLLV